MTLYLYPPCYLNGGLITCAEMKIKSVILRRFRRFQDLSIPDLPPARLVVMAGPTGQENRQYSMHFPFRSRHNTLALIGTQSTTNVVRKPRAGATRLKSSFIRQQAAKKLFTFVLRTETIQIFSFSISPSRLIRWTNCASAG